MAADGRSGLQSWLYGQVVVFGIAMGLSLLIVKLVWFTTLGELYGQLGVFPWLVASFALSLVAIVYVTTEAM
ncbi:hypothetical protein [Halorientalis salina]|uniref:hypothetical protein n=1 Tax=Halorientalis salina TaxID=2932266 RepID=UPI0010AC8C66|nr:hypothetical protein [Halorientalis salina]